MPETTLHPPRRTPFIDCLDAGLRLGRMAGLVEPPKLEREALMANAAEYTGLTDFGDPWFLDPFDTLIEALHGEARLNAAVSGRRKSSSRKCCTTGCGRSNGSSAIPRSLPVRCRIRS